MADLRRGVVLVACVLGFGAGCDDCNSLRAQTYFERNIEPILSSEVRGQHLGLSLDQLR